MKKLSEEQLRLTAWAGIIGPAIFVAVFTIEGWIRPGYEPLKTFVSALSLGPRGWIQIANFLVFGFLLFVFTRGVAAEFQTGKAARGGLVLLTIISACYFISGPFVMDPTGTPQNLASVHGMIHGIAGAIVFLLMPISCFVYLRRFSSDPKWRSLKWWTIVLGSISTVGLILLTISTKIPGLQISFSGWTGLIQRTSIVPFMVWVFVFALEVLKQIGQALPVRVMDGKETFMELTENTLERNGCRIHYWTGGKTDAPLVVFTHGATIDHHEWDATLPLIGENFRILTWDMRGHGLSRPAIFHLAEAVTDLLAVLDLLDVREATFVGHSMGGNLHQEFAFQHPERVKTLVMLDCTWNFMQLSGSDNFWLKAAEPIFKLYPYKTLIDQSVAVSATSKESQELLRKAMQVLSKEEYVHVLMDATLCLRYDPDYKITQPLLLMMGDKEATGNIRKAMPLWARHDGVNLVIIPNAKHAANLDQPEIFHKHLLDFLQAKLKL